MRSSSRGGIPSELMNGLSELNGLRASKSVARREQLEAWFDRDFAAPTKLAVYGSLAPGQTNHHELASLRGNWRTGCSVTGELVRSGWASSVGYPALRWSPNGASVPVHLLVSDDLRSRWPDLDAFEGSDYLRILVPVLADGRLVDIANLYAVRS